jgi:hypothetical protein
VGQTRWRCAVLIEFLDRITDNTRHTLEKLMQSVSNKSRQRHRVRPTWSAARQYLLIGPEYVTLIKLFIGFYSLTCIYSFIGFGRRAYYINTVTLLIDLVW